MRKRGPKPVDVGLLNSWEFEWYKALHVLRDGIALPGRAHGVPPLHISPAMVREWLPKLKRMTDAEFLRANNQVCERISGQTNDEKDPPDEMALRWAGAEKQRNIAALEKYLNPSSIPGAAERRDLWRSLWRAQSVPILSKVCERWADLPDVRHAGLGVFPNYVVANAAQFLRMKRDKRFPKTPSPIFDESRVEYLARGMAGVLVDVSPMTGIERLRNMKHAPGGPLWKTDASGQGYCTCWRCELDRSRPAYTVSAEAWWNGMALFMEMAKGKDPKRRRTGK